MHGVMQLQALTGGALAAVHVLAWLDWAPVSCEVRSR